MSQWPEEDGVIINPEIYNPAFYRDFFDETVFPETVTWNQHIRGLFTEHNARCMISKSVNLTWYDYVKGNHETILYKLTSSDPRQKMPPGDPWSEYQIELFRRWVNGKFQPGPTPSATNYNAKIIRAPLRYQFPETLPDDFIATFYQNVKPLFTNCDQKFGMDALDNYTNYNVNIFDYKQLRDAANAAKAAKEKKEINIINDILDGKFPKGNPWPQTWKNVLNNWIKYGCKEGEAPIGMEHIPVESD